MRIWKMVWWLNIPNRFAKLHLGCRTDRSGTLQPELLRNPNLSEWWRKWGTSTKHLLNDAQRLGRVAPAAPTHSGRPSLPELNPLPARVTRGLWQRILLSSVYFIIFYELGRGNPLLNIYYIKNKQKKAKKWLQMFKDTKKEGKSGRLQQGF